MSVITTDTLIEGIRRDDVLAWLSNPDSHDKFLQGAFDDVKRTGERTFPAFAGRLGPVSYTHLTLPTSDLV